MLQPSSGSPETILDPQPITAGTEVFAGAMPAVVTPGRRSRFLRPPQFLMLLLGNRKAAFGLILLTLFVSMAIFAPFLTHYSPTDFADLPGLSPSPSHPFGTTHQGQDVFSQVVWGARVSLLVGASAALLATLIAASIGMTAAYLGGWADEFLNLITNIVLVIPGIPLLIVIASYLPVKGGIAMVLIIASTAWAGEARVLRSQALSLRNRDFVLAAKASGESTRRIVFSEIMPNMTSRIAAGFLGAFVGAILAEAGLEFLGFGDVNAVSWGVTLFWAQNNSALLTGEWWHFAFPGLAIALVATSLIFINYGVDEISNPRLRGSKMSRKQRRAMKRSGALR